jgi:hypothetical protein
VTDPTPAKPKPNKAATLALSIGVAAIIVGGGGTAMLLGSLQALGIAALVLLGFLIVMAGVFGYLD